MVVVVVVVMVGSCAVVWHVVVILPRFIPSTDSLVAGRMTSLGSHMCIVVLTRLITIHIAGTQAVELVGWVTRRVILWRGSMEGISVVGVVEGKCCGTLDKKQQKL